MDTLSLQPCHMIDTLTTSNTAVQDDWTITRTFTHVSAVCLPSCYCYQFSPEDPEDNILQYTLAFPERVAINSIKSRAPCM